MLGILYIYVFKVVWKSFRQFPFLQMFSSAVSLTGRGFFFFFFILYTVHFQSIYGSGLVFAFLRDMNRFCSFTFFEIHF